MALIKVVWAHFSQLSWLMPLGTLQILQYAITKHSTPIGSTPCEPEHICLRGRKTICNTLRIRHAVPNCFDSSGERVFMISHGRHLHTRAGNALERDAQPINIYHADEPLGNTAWICELWPTHFGHSGVKSWAQTARPAKLIKYLCWLSSGSTSGHDIVTALTRMAHIGFNGSNKLWGFGSSIACPQPEYNWNSHF